MPQNIAESDDCNHVLRASTASTFTIVSSETVVGPSAPSTARQEAIPEQLPLNSALDVLHVEISFIVMLLCKWHACWDVYCKARVKGLFRDATKNQSLFLPKCHRKLFDISSVKNELTIEELAAFETAQEEFTSTNKVFSALERTVRGFL
jgi:hypothetical protein